MVIGAEYATSEVALWALLAALVGFAIGWILRKWWLDRKQGDEIATIRAAEEDKRAKLQHDLDECKTKSTSLVADLDHRQADIDRLDAQIAERDQKLESAEADLTAVRAELSGWEDKVADRESTIASLRSAAEKGDPEVAGLRKELESANGTIGTLRKDTDGYKNTIEALRGDLDAERRKQADLEEKLTATVSEAESATASLANTRSATDGLQARIAELEESASSPDPNMSGLQADLAAAERSRDDVAARLTALEAEHANCGVVEVPAEPAAIADLPDKDVAVAKVAEIATRTRGEGPVVDDDLKKIHGVGPKLEGLLKSMDITSFKQVANFTLEDIQYVTAALDAFPGRIERDDWMASAAEEHSKKYNEPA